jgi:hypothetical protein
MAVRFDANTDLLKRTTGTIAASTANLSGCCWVKRKVDTGAFATCLYVHSATANHEVWLECDATGDVLHMFDFQTTEADLSGPTLTIDTWFFVAFQRTNAARALYYGTEAGGTLTKVSDTSTHTSASAASEFWIGQDIYTEGFNGEIAYVRLWDTNLSDAEMDAEWRSATPVKSANLRGDWRLASAATATTDSGPNALTLTSGGTLTDGGANPTPPTASGLVLPVLCRPPMHLLAR